MDSGMDIREEDSIEYKFGRCHFTWPVLRELVQQKSSRVQQVITSLQRELDSEPRVRRHQKQNLLGFCLFEDGKKMEAKKVFENILRENSMNINALKNLAFVLRNLGSNETRIEKITVKVTQLLTVTKDDLAGRMNALKAEQIAEEASAYGTFDQHQKSDNTLAMRIRRRALDIGKKDANRFIYNEWKYGLAFDLARLDNLCISEGIETEVYFEEAAHLCYSMVMEKMEEEDKDDIQIFKAKIWSRLGDLVNRKKERSLQKLFNSEKKLDDFNVFPKAMGESTDHPYVLRTLAECYRNDGDFETALKFFTKSIEGKRGEDMWWARNRRGRTYLTLYKNSQKAKEPRNDYLAKAEEDMRRSLELYSMHYVLVDLAKVLKCKGSPESLDEALESCIKVGRMKGGANNKELYKVMKEIFSLLGKTDLDHEIQNTGCSFRDHSNDAGLTQLDRIDFLVFHSNLPKVEQFSDEIRKKVKYFKSSRAFSDCDEAKLLEVEKTIGRCQKVIIILTEKIFLNDSWIQKIFECKYMKERLAQHCVLPIFLDQHISEVPDSIKDEHFLKIDGDQKEEVFWNLLLEFLAVPPPFFNKFEDIRPAIEFLAEKATLDQVTRLCRAVFKFENAEIENINHDHLKSDVIKIQLLFHWVTKKGEKATLACLLQGLHQLECNDLADKLREKFK